MNTRELEAVLKEDVKVGPLFAGVFACDKLPREVTYPSALVMNTEPHTLPGEHWVAAFFAKDGQGEFFDSYGREPQGAMRALMNRCAWNVKYNQKPVQGLLASTCGHYCTYYLLHRARGMNMHDIVKVFGTDLQKNDRFVLDFVEDFMY